MVNQKRRSLADAFPDIAKEWYAKKNGDIKPEGVACFSNKKCWWICKTNSKHVWQAAVQNRTLKKAGCPFCSRKFASDDNRLTVLYPEIAAEWHPTHNRYLYLKVEGGWKGHLNRQIPTNALPEKNRRLLPSDLSYASNESIYWQCKLNPDHVWKAKVLSRTIGGHGCPFCSRNAVSKDNNLAVTHPQIARQWHPSRNLPTTPSDVTAGSGRKFWWRCFKIADHIWQAQVASILRSRRQGKTGCPFCCGNKVSIDNCLEKVHPEIARLWHQEMNKELTAKDVTQSSKRKVFWQCSKVKTHFWQATVSNMVAQNSKGKSGCPLCAGKRASTETSLRAACPSAAQLWHCELNESLTPDNVTAGSGKLAWWHCTKSSDHAFQMKVQNMVTNINGGFKTKCPHCENERSLGQAFPDVAKQLCAKRNGVLEADKINPGSHRTYWWQCPSNKNHVWQEEVRRRVKFWQKGVLCKTCNAMVKKSSNLAL